MRYLRLYKNDSDFKTHEQEAGGTGNDVESVVPGIVKTLDERKMYFNPHDKEIRFHTITVNYKDIIGNTLTESKTIVAKYISGVSEEIVLTPKPVENYIPRDYKKTVTISDESVVDFIYDSKYTYEPLTFEILSGGSIGWISSGSGSFSEIYPKTIEYSLNGGSWVSITPSKKSSVTIEVKEGDKIQFRGNNATYSDNSSTYCGFSGSSTVRFNAIGNIMSLVNSTGFSTATTLTSGRTFYQMFFGCRGLVSSENLVLPATTLTTSCYYGMFDGCINLTASPIVLPAAAMVESCYSSMFGGCTSLTTAPELPATTLANNCYSYMFYGCTSLATAPSLPATTLASYCYQGMFHSCTSLATAPAILPAKTLAIYCYQNMFYSCSTLESSPILPAKNLVAYCYSQMFSYCSSLRSIKCLAMYMASNSTYNWVYRVAYSGTFIKNSDMSGWTKSANAIPSSWTVKDNITFVATPGIHESGGTAGVEIESNIGGWSATSMEEWLSISPSTGEASSATITIMAEPTSLEREGSIVFTDEYSTMYIPVIQSDKFVSPLSFDIISGGTIEWVASDSSHTRTIEYKLNDDNWVSITSNVSGSAPSISVAAGDVVEFRGNNSYYGSGGTFFTFWHNQFSVSGVCFNVRGNIMSLINKTDYVGRKTFGKGAFAGLFYACNGLISAENLVLPVDTLTEYCYNEMFYSCTTLTIAPELPATTMAGGCYKFMFEMCTSLTVAPELPSTNLSNAYECYMGMFIKCTSLSKSPILPARRVGQSSYAFMFQNCKALTTPPDLPAVTLSESSYTGMFSYCDSLTTAPALPALSLKQGCYSQMFYGCTSLTTAPELPASALTPNCYDLMFSNCTNLNYVKCLATNISADNCINYWLSYVSPTGTFVKDADMSGWTTGSNGIPNNWAVENIENPSGIPLTFDILSSGTIFWKASNDDIVKTIEYNINNTNWISLTSSTAGTQFNVSSGDVVQFRGDNASYGSNMYVEEKHNSFSGTTAIFNVRGNIMSLINSTGYTSITQLTNESTFGKLFYYCETLIDAKDLVLPATTLKNFCYFGMFWNCSSLLSAPRILPATNLNNCEFCYYYMFKGCSSLKDTPILPAITLGNSCYGSMFETCSSLTIAPELPSTTLSSSCYSHMFNNCSSLVMAPTLPATRLKDSCYYGMFYDCRSLKMAPELPAQNLVYQCYDTMFYNCRGLKYIKCLATDISNSNCTMGWTQYCPTGGVFIKHPDMRSWETGASGIPNGWSVRSVY